MYTLDRHDNQGASRARVIFCLQETVRLLPMNSEHVHFSPELELELLMRFDEETESRR